MEILTLVLKLVGIVCATVVSYKLATTKDDSGDTHFVTAAVVEILAIIIIFS